MELGGRSLKDYVYYRQYLEQKETSYFLGQLLSGVDYCHKRRLIHRDLKLENIVFSREQPYALKIIDFGIAGLAAHDHGHLCTLRYAAPEMVASSDCAADNKLDVWSMGVILYRCLFGCFPFEGQTQAQLQRAILQKPLSFPRKHGYQREVSTKARELLEIMLEKNAKLRATVWDVLEHPWMDENQASPFQSIKHTLQILHTQSSRSSRPCSPFEAVPEFESVPPRLKRTSIKQQILKPAGIFRQKISEFEIERETRNKFLHLKNSKSSTQIALCSALRGARIHNKENQTPLISPTHRRKLSQARTTKLARVARKKSKGQILPPLQSKRERQLSIGLGQKQKKCRLFQEARASLCELPSLSSRQTSAKSALGKCQNYKKIQ